MEKEKRKRDSVRRWQKIPYTLIAIIMIVITCIVGFSIGTIVTTLPDQPLRVEWNAYMTETATYKATHNPVIPVTQTVSAIETQWIQIKITQTAISK